METIILATILQTTILDAAAFGELADINLEFYEEIASTNLTNYTFKYGLHNNPNQNHTINILRFWYSDIQTCPNIYEINPFLTLNRCYANMEEARTQLKYYESLQAILNREIPQVARQRFRLSVWEACRDLTSVIPRNHPYEIRVRLRNLRDLIGPAAFMSWEIPGPIE